MNDEIIIEVATPHNNDIVFRPVGSTRLLRGRKVRSGYEANQSSLKRPGMIEAMGIEIPGLHIALSIPQQTGRVFDPLDSDSGREKLAELESKVNAGRALNTVKLFPVKEKVVENLTQNDIATWLHWMRRHVDEGDAVVVQGDVKKKVEGRVRVTFGNPDPASPQYLDEWEVWREGGWKAHLRELLTGTEKA